MTSRSRGRQRGATLIPTLMLTLTLMATSAALSSNALHRYAAERARGEESIAQHAAEAGLDVALYELETNSDLDGNGVGSASGSLTSGRYAATMTPAFAGAGTYTITSVGTHGAHSRRMQMVVACTLGTGIGLLGLSNVSINGNASIDSYDSGAGTYASQVKGGHAGSKGNLASNGNISASGSGAIWGDATPGPGGKFSGGFKVSGSTAPAKQSISEAPYVYKPPGAAKTAWSGSGTLTSGTYQYKSVSLTSKDLLKISGNVTLYVDGAISSAGQATLEILKGSTLKIFQGNGSISITGGGIVNDVALPSALQIQSASTSTVKVAGNSAFYGTIYATAADFTKSGTADYFGSVIANSVTVSGTGWVHYDSSLAGVGAPTFSVAMTRGWLRREAPRPDRVRRAAAGRSRARRRRPAGRG